MRKVVTIVNNAGRRCIDYDYWGAFYFNSLPSMLGIFLMNGNRVEFEGDAGTGKVIVRKGEDVIHEEEWTTVSSDRECKQDEHECMCHWEYDDN